MSLSEKIVAAIDKVIPPDLRPIGHHEAFITAEDAEEVMMCLRQEGTGYSWVEAFEAAVARACGARYAVAMSSGTAALQVALRACGVVPGSKVAIPALTFAGTANAVLLAGCEPVFIDCCEDGMGMDPAALIAIAAEVKLGAVVAVDLLGHPDHLADISGLCRNGLGVPLIEDAAQALGSQRGNVPCGAFGTAGVVSFNANKIVTAGGGGALVTDNRFVADMARSLATTARDPHQWEITHSLAAGNHRMPNLNAALGLSQIGRLDEILMRKIMLSGVYQRELQAIEEIESVATPEGCVSNYWLNAFIINMEQAAEREGIFDALHGAGIRARALFTPLPLLEPFKGFKTTSIVNSVLFHRRTVCLPSGIKLALSID